MLDKRHDHTSTIIICIVQGIVASGLVISLQTWCIHKGGPVCVAVFQPVQTVLVAILAALFLGDQLYSGGSVFVSIQSVCSNDYSYVN